jgi:hypothetical protein
MLRSVLAAALQWGNTMTYQSLHINTKIDNVAVTPATTQPTEPMLVLDECRAIMVKKSNDYQNPNSSIRQADYYPNGCLSILDAIHAKTLRIRSVMEAMTYDTTYKPNFESLEDSAKDLINYSAFFVAYSRGKIDGQNTERDWLNRKIIKKSNV